MEWRLLARPVTRISDIVNERRGISAAVRFVRYFENGPSFWTNLQTRCGLEISSDEISAKVERDVQPLDTLAIRS